MIDPIHSPTGAGVGMSNFVKELRTEISRVAKRESRAEVVILKKAASQSKAEISGDFDTSAIQEAVSTGAQG